MKILLQFLLISIVLCRGLSLTNNNLVFQFIFLKDFLHLYQIFFFISHSQLQSDQLLPQQHSWVQICPCQYKELKHFLLFQWSWLVRKTYLLTLNLFLFYFSHHRHFWKMKIFELNIELDLNLFRYESINHTK